MSLLRKNALFYRTLNRTQAGDLFMSLIHTCQLCGTNSFDYLIALQRHAAELAAQPSNWTAVILQKSLGVRRGRGSDLTGGRKADRPPPRPIRRDKEKAGLNLQPV